MKKKFIKKMSKGLGVIGGLATVVAPIVACGETSGSTDNKKDELDVKKVLDGISGDAKAVEKALIDAVPEGSALDVDQANDLGITMPADMLGATVTYSHNEISEDGSLEVKIKITKGTISKDKTLNIAITGIDVNAVSKDIEGSSTTTNKTQIDAVLPTTVLDKAKAAELGITLPQNTRETIITYSHEAITADGDLTVKINTKKGATEQNKTLTINVTGINDAVRIKDETSIQTVIDGIGDTGTYKAPGEKLKIEAVSDLTDLTSDKAKELGITFPDNTLKTTVKYKHVEMNTDGDLSVDIEVSKGTAKAIEKTITLNVQGIDANVGIKSIIDSKVSHEVNKTSIAAVPDFVDLTSTLATELGITIPSSPAGVSYKYKHAVIDHDGDHSVTIQATKGVTQEKDVTVSITGINAAKAKLSDDQKLVNDIAGNINAAATKNVDVDQFIAVTNGDLDGTMATKLGISLPPSIPGDVDVTYTHALITADGDLKVDIEVSKGTVTNTTPVSFTIKITGIDAYNALEKISTHQVTVNKVKIDKVDSWTPLTSTIAGDLGIDISKVPSTPSTVLKYKITADITSDIKTNISVQATTGDGVNTKEIPIDIVGINAAKQKLADDTKAVNAVSGDIKADGTEKEVDKVNILKVDQASKTELTQSIATSLGLTFPTGGNQGTTVIYWHDAISADGPLLVNVKVSKGNAPVKNTSITVNIKGINAAKTADAIKGTAKTVNVSSIPGIPSTAPLPFDKAAADSLGISFPDPKPDDATITYWHDGIDHDGTLDVHIKIVQNTIVNEKTLHIAITGIDAKKQNDVDATFKIISTSGSGTYTAKGDIPAANNKELTHDNPILAGAITAPEHLEDFKITYSYPKTTQDGPLIVHITVIWRGTSITKSGDRTVQVSGIQDNKYVTEVLSGISQTSSTVKFSAAAKAGKGELNSTAAAALGIGLPSETHGARIEYTLTPIPPTGSTKYKITIKVIIGGASSTKEFPLTINGKDEFDVKSALDAMGYDNNIKITLPKDQIEEKTDQPLLPNNPFGITGVIPAVSPMTITYSHILPQPDIHTLAIVITVAQNGTHITRTITINLGT